MAYNITGPFNLGTAATTGTVNGSLTFSAGSNTYNFNAAGGGGANTISNFILSANGDLLTRTAGSLARLAVGTNGQILQVVGGLPAWADSIDSAAVGFYAELSSAQSITTATETTLTGYTVSGNATQYNSGGLNITTGIFTAPSAGKYEVAAAVGWATGNNVGLRRCGIKLNTATKILLDEIQPSADTTIKTFNKVTAATINLAANDTLELYVFQTSGSSINVGASGDTRFSVIKVSA